MSTHEADSTPPSAPAAPKKKKTTTKKASSKRVSVPPRAAPVKLEPAEIAQARATARPWDRHVRFATRDFFVHPTFGVGVVTEALPEFIVCLFEGGETRKLIHAR